MSSQSSKPWSKQEWLGKEKYRKGVPDLQEILDIAGGIPDLRIKALFSLCYLTAGRITEVLNINVDDIIPEQIKGRPVWKIILINLKNKKRVNKTLIITLDKSENLTLCEYINTYIKSLIGKKLFDFSKQRAWQLLDKYTGFNPHFIRHIRLTHLVTIYDFTDRLLVKYAGWEDSKPGSHYINLRTDDFLDKL